jgi:Mob1/phocein family
VATPVWLIIKMENTNFGIQCFVPQFCWLYFGIHFGEKEDTGCHLMLMSFDVLEHLLQFFIFVWFWQMAYVCFLGRPRGPFRPKRKIPKDTKQYQLHKHAMAILGSGNLKTAVRLPPKEDLDDWLCVNSSLLSLSPPLYLSLSLSSFSLTFIEAIDFYNQVNHLYGSVSEFCTERSCPIMSANPFFNFRDE